MALDPAQIAALNERHTIIVPILDMYFASGTARFALAPWGFEVDGNDYTGVGPISSIAPITQAADSIEGLELMGTGLDASVETIVASEPYHGRPIRLSKLFLHHETHARIGAPKVEFVGRIVDIVTIENKGKFDVIIRAEHFDAALQRPAPIRMNDAFQQRRFPGDRGMEHVETLVDTNIVWPSRSLLMK